MWLQLLAGHPQRASNKTPGSDRTRGGGPKVQLGRSTKGKEHSLGAWCCAGHIPAGASPSLWWHISGEPVLEGGPVSRACE